VGLHWTSDQLIVENYDNTQHAPETNILAPSGIRIHNPSKQTIAYPCLRTRGIWNRSGFLQQYSMFYFATEYREIQLLHKYSMCTAEFLEYKLVRS